jgi:hypothetical protein
VSGYKLRVRHGAGEETVDLGGKWRGLIPALELLDSDNRYRVLYAIFDAASKARRIGAEATAAQYRAAFVDGRLRKRKMPRQAAVKVWIEPARVTL